MAPVSYKTEFENMQEMLEPLGYSIALPPNCTYQSKLNPDLFECDEWSEQKILVTIDQLKYLPLPLYNPETPLFYQILCDSRFARALYQIGSDAIRISYQYSRRAAGLETTYAKENLNPNFPTDIYSTSDYTVENFFKHYTVGLMRTNDSKWAVRLSRNLKDFPDEGKRIMCDVDFHSNFNTNCRKSKDSSWRNCPVILSGYYISGWNASGEANPLPSDFPAYSPWKLRYAKGEEARVKKAAKKIADAAKALASTSRSAAKKRVSKQDSSSNKRAKTSSYSREDDPDVLSVSDFRSIFAGCFGGDTTLPHESPELTDALNCLSKVCLESTVKKSVVHDSSQVFTPEMIYSLQTVTGRAAHSCIADYERRVKGMKKINDKLRLKSTAQAKQLAIKDARIAELEEINRGLKKSARRTMKSYQALGKNWEILVENSENECLRRELKGIRRVCEDHQIDPAQYVFDKIPDEKDLLPFYNPEDDDDSVNEQTESDDSEQTESDNDDQDAGGDEDEDDADAGEGDDNQEDSQQDVEGDEEADLEEDDDVDMNRSK